MEFNNKKYEIFQPLLLASIMAIGIVIGFKMNDTTELPFIDSVDTDIEYPIGKIEEVIRFVENKYVDSVDRNDLYESAFEAMFSSLDPHSIYIPAERLKGINDEMRGDFVGIGIEAAQIEDTVYVVNITEDSPADKNGLNHFDKILSIDDIDVAGKGMAFDSIKSLLKKNEGDSLSLVILRGVQIIDITTDIGVVKLPSVSKVQLLNDSTSLIRINRFSSKTYAEFMDQLEYLVDAKKLKNLIIDLRNNPGGYLPEAVNILSQLFQEKEKLLVYTEGKSRKKAEYKTTGKAFFNVNKIAVLVNENSASASEILAAAVKEWDRGIIVGRRTFGKGLVQEQYDLNNGGALRITVARYYTPSGRCIQKPYDNNEIFAIDSLNEKKFNTLILNRKLESEGGVNPDVFIPDEDNPLASFDNDTFVFLRSELIKYSSKNGIPFPFDSANYYNFVAHLKDQNKELSKEQINASIDAMRSHLNFEEINLEDPFIVEATRYFNNELQLAD